MLPARRLTVGLLGAAVVLAAVAATYVATPKQLDFSATRAWVEAQFAPPPVAAPAPPPPVPVTVARARRQDVELTLGGIGTVQAYNTVSVKSRVDGEIVQIQFTEGQDVKPGDPLALIDPRPYQAQLQQQLAARDRDSAMVQSALLDLARYQDLVKKDFASRQQVDQQVALVAQDRAQVAADEAQISYAQTQLAYTVIRSPIEGRTGIRQIDVGNIVHAADNSAIVMLTQLRPISVVFTLAAGAVAAGHLVPGQTHARVRAIAPDGHTVLDEGTIELVDNQVDQTTGTIKLKARFPNAALTLWPGNFVTGRIVVGEAKDGVTVPAAALRHGPRGDFVWVVTADDHAEVHGVTAGQAEDGRVLIERGLHGDERVVTDGHYRLENKVRVQVVRGPAGG